MTSFHFLFKIRAEFWKELTLERPNDSSRAVRKPCSVRSKDFTVPVLLKDSGQLRKPWPGVLEFVKGLYTISQRGPEKQ